MHKRRILTVERVDQETPQAVTIHFSQPPTDRVWYKPGQYITLMAEIAGEEVYRCYSISTSPRLDNTLGITVKEKPGGHLSGWLVKEVKPGLRLEVIDPMGRFFTDISVKNNRHLAFFAAGSGISPVFSMIRAVLFGEPESRVSLVYSNRNWPDTIFKEKLDQLQRIFPGRILVVHHHSQPSTGALPRLKAESVMVFAAGFEDGSTTYYLCGPESYMQMVLSGLQEAGVASENIFQEHFDLSREAARDLSDIGDLHPQDVAITWKGETQSIRVAAGSTILESALAQEVYLPHACKRGVCSACMAHLRSGEVRMARQDVLLEFEVDKGLVLLCQAFPVSAGVEIEVGF